MKHLSKPCIIDVAFSCAASNDGHGHCAATYDLGATPTTKEAQAVADELYADFVSEEVDKVEMIYTKFVSLISSDPVVQTLLPLTPQVCT